MQTPMPCADPISVNGPAGPIRVRCKQCLNCRISKQSAISLRALLESRVSTSGHFWTLTYAEAPEIGGWEDFSKFLKRLRSINRRENNPIPIRFLGCGEYGEKSGRFHYHALIFNDQIGPNPLYHERLWPHGFVYIGTVTPGSIRYTARYTLKFNEKGRESRASWSTNPPLGSVGIRMLARYMRENGYKLQEPPTWLKIEGHNYTLDQAMRNEFGRAWHLDDSWEAGSSSLARHTEYVIECKLGDPVRAQARRQEERNTFWESARIHNGKL